MKQKVYFGITRAIGTASIVGIVANLQLTGSRAATPEELQIILDKVKANASDSLADTLRDGTYPNTVSVWDKRADARAAVANLQSYKSPHFSYSVSEFGDAERSAAKCKGWRILTASDTRGGERTISAWNQPGAGATVRLDGNDKNNSYGNFLFPNRDAARKLIKRESLEGYLAVRVDA